MKKTLNNCSLTGRSTVRNMDELLQKIEEGEADIREGRTEDAFEWLARFKAEHVQNMENK